MKRNMDLVREILKATADAQGSLDGSALVDGINDFGIIAYHVEIMRDAGLIEAMIVKDTSGTPVLVRIEGLTWDGNDFLDAVSNDSVWKKVKLTIAQKAGAATLDITKAVAVKILSETLLQ